MIFSGFLIYYWIFAYYFILHFFPFDFRSDAFKIVSGRIFSGCNFWVAVRLQFFKHDTREDLYKPHFAFLYTLYIAPGSTNQLQSIADLTKKRRIAGSKKIGK